jgi:hypothetical protein
LSPELPRTRSRATGRGRVGRSEHTDNCRTSSSDHIRLPDRWRKSSAPAARTAAVTRGEDDADLAPESRQSASESELRPSAPCFPRPLASSRRRPTDHESRMRGACCSGADHETGASRVVETRHLRHVDDNATRSLRQAFTDPRAEHGHRQGGELTDRSHDPGRSPAPVQPHGGRELHPCPDPPRRVCDRPGGRNRRRRRAGACSHRSGFRTGPRRSIARMSVRTMHIGRAGRRRGRRVQVWATRVMEPSPTRSKARA